MAFTQNNPVAVTFSPRDIALMETHGLRNLLNVLSLNADFIRQHFRHLAPAMGEVIHHLDLIHRHCLDFEPTSRFVQTLASQFDDLGGLIRAELPDPEADDLRQAKLIFEQVLQ